MCSTVLFLADRPLCRAPAVARVRRAQASVCTRDGGGVHMLLYMICASTSTTNRRRRQKTNHSIVIYKSEAGKPSCSSYCGCSCLYDWTTTRVQRSAVGLPWRPSVARTHALTHSRTHALTHSPFAPGHRDLLAISLIDDRSVGRLRRVLVCPRPEQIGCITLCSPANIGGAADASSILVEQGTPALR